MKSIKILFTLLIVAIAVNGFGQGIAGSAHDFQDGVGAIETWNASGQICMPCHAPHNNVNAATELLWNHTLATNDGYIPYSSPTMQAAPTATVTGSSVLCLSCHDGTIGLEQFGSNPGSATPNNMTVVRPAAAFGTDLSNDHPISFAYADGGDGLNLTTAAWIGGGGTVEDLLYGTTDVECSSCHDVHDEVGNANLLVIDNAASALCLTCHAK